MITEDYVSFEIAKLLKEKGFKHWCYKCYGDAVYHKGTPISFDEEYELKSAGLEDEIEYVEGGYLYDFGCDNSKEDTKVWAAPTLQMAMKWLREVHNIAICICAYYPVDPYELNHRNNKPYWKIRITNRIYSRDYDSFNTYEEACEAAIKYCLKNLI